MRQLMFVLLMCCSVVTSWGQQMVIDRVVATVGGEIVMLSEVEEQKALMESRSPNLPEDIRCSIVEQLLANKLLINQAKLDSILVGEEEVETQLNARIERILSFMNNDLEQFEAYYGQSVNEVKEQFREDLRNQLLMERMRNEIMTDVTVTPSEVKAFFERIPKDSLPYFNSEVEIGEIVAKPKVNANERKKVMDKLTEIREQIVNEEATFEAMAEKFSEDGSARLGGDLGWSTRGKFVQAFEAAAYKLEPGEISPVIESEFGFHIIKMEGRRGNSIKVRHILIKPDITDADLELTRKFLDSIRLLILEDSVNFSIAVKRYSDEDQQSYNNDGRMVNQLTGNTFFEVGDLDPDIFFAIDSMEVGGISSAFEFRGPTGESYFRIVQLQSRTSPHTANLQQDYSKIQKAAIESKQNQFIGNWIEDKIGRTYIEIAGVYEGCPTLQNWEIKRYDQQVQVEVKEKEKKSKKEKVIRP